VRQERQSPHPNSPAGSGGPGGFRTAGSLGTSKNLLDVSTTDSATSGLLNARIPKESAGQPGWTVDPPPAVHPVLSVVSAATWDDLKRYAELFLGPESFDLGVCVGIAGGLASGVNSLLSLLKTFTLEGVYEAVHHPLELGNPGLLPPYGMARLVELALGDPRLEKAHAQCITLLDELKHILEDPKKFLRQLGEHYEQDYAAKWAGIKQQLSQRTLIGDFQAGRITGQVLLDVIMILLTVYGAAEFAAKMAAEIPELLDLVKELGGARNVLQVGKSATVSAVAAEDAELVLGVGQQRALAARVAETSSEWDVAAAGSIRNVNPTGGTMNCVNCCIATDASLAGHPASALPGGVTPISTLENIFSSKFVRVEGPDAIEGMLESAGPGSRGIVYVKPEGSNVGHVFNVVNQGGTIRFLDGQTGKQFIWSGEFDDIRLLRTN
jgi:hypothetical protein